MLTLGGIVARISGQFDASRSLIVQWTNERQARMVAESLWRAVEREVAVSVAGQAVYLLSDEMVRLRGLKVGGVVYGPASRDQMWALADPTNQARLSGPGVYAESVGSDGELGVELYPAPSEAGLSIVGQMAWRPPALAADGDEPVLPEEFQPYLLDGVVAQAYEELDGRWDLAKPHEDRFAEGIVRLTRLRNARVGGGAVQAQVAGYHFGR